RRRRRGRGGAEVRVEAREGGRPEGRPEGQMPVARPAPPPIVFETSIPTDVLPPLAAIEVAPPPESEATFDEAVWGELPDAGRSLEGDPVIDPDDGWYHPHQPDLAAGAELGAADAVM